MPQAFLFKVTNENKYLRVALFGGGIRVNHYCQYLDGLTDIFMILHANEHICKSASHLGILLRSKVQRKVR